MSIVLPEHKVVQARERYADAVRAAAARVEGFSRRYYLLGYCSPARAGEHEVTISTSVGGKSGSLTYPFDARGFGPNCDPTRPPSFDIRRPRPPKAPPRETGEPDSQEPGGAGTTHF